MGGKESRPGLSNLGITKRSKGKEDIQNTMDARAGKFCKPAQPLEDIGEPPPLARIERKRRTSDSPDRLSSPAQATKWVAQAKRRRNYDDDEWPSKQARYSVLQDSSLVHSGGERLPVAWYSDSVHRMNVQQVAAVPHLYRVNPLANNADRLHKRTLPVEKYFPGCRHQTATFPSTMYTANTPNGSLPHQLVGRNGHYLYGHDNHRLSQIDGEQRNNAVDICSNMRVDQTPDASNASIARKGEERDMALTSGKWACVPNAIRADLRQWLPESYKALAHAQNGVPILVPHRMQPTSLAQKSDEGQLHDSGKLPLMVLTNEGDGTLTVARLFSEGQNGENRAPTRARSSSPEPEIDPPLKKLCHRVLVEEPADVEGLQTLTAILLQAIDLARPEEDRRCGGNGSNHIIPSSWEHLNGNRQDKPYTLAAGNVHGPIDVEDGISPNEAIRFQGLVQDDPALRPLPGEDQAAEKTVYWCRSCRVTFKWRRHLEHHFLSHRTSERASVCHICGKCFTRGDHLNRHASMHNLTEYACQLCGQRFVRASHLEMHWASDHNRYVHQITSVVRQPEYMCLTPASDLLQAGSHIFRHSANGYAFSYSHSNGDSLSEDSRSSPDRVQLNGSFQTPTGSPTESVSGHSERISNRTRNSPTHNHDNDQGSFDIPEGEITSLSPVPVGCGPRPYRCQVCARAFHRLAHLQRHHRVHLGEKPLRCSLCSRSYSSAELLRTHVITQHDNNVINCKMCGKEFSTMGALTNHQKVHQREQNRAESALMARSFVHQ